MLTLLSYFTVWKNTLWPIESTNHPLPVAALSPPLFSVVWKHSHLSRKHPLVLLLFKQVRRIAHVVAVHKAVCVVHADRVHGKPAEEESEDTHRKCIVQAIYWQLTCSIYISAIDLWEFSLGEYKCRLLVPRNGLTRAELSSPFLTSRAHGYDDPGLEATRIWHYNYQGHQELFQTWIDSFLSPENYILEGFLFSCFKETRRSQQCKKGKKGKKGTLSFLQKRKPSSSS